jgi:predicted cation transporter
LSLPDENVSPQLLQVLVQKIRLEVKRKNERLLRAPYRGCSVYFFFAAAFFAGAFFSSFLAAFFATVLPSGFYYCLQFVFKIC